MEVRKLQDRLILLNFLYKQSDGSFDGVTEEAVRRFQKYNNRLATGIVQTADYDVMMSTDAIARFHYIKPSPGDFTCEEFINWLYDISKDRGMVGFTYQSIKKELDSNGDISYSMNIELAKSASTATDGSKALILVTGNPDTGMMHTAATGSVSAKHRDAIMGVFIGAFLRTMDETKASAIARENTVKEETTAGKVNAIQQGYLSLKAVNVTDDLGIIFIN